jgi:hypothetical protein
MKPKEAKEEFERFVAEAGAVVSEFKPIDAVRLMLDFYQQERAEGCDLQADGDMLLFQWGVHEWGKQGRWFEFNLTRQLMDDEEQEEENTAQLSLTCYFPPTPALNSIKPGSKWCGMPDELAGFEYFVVKSPAFLAVGKLDPENVALTFGPV